MSISLKIKGNKRGNEGIGADLVSIGDDRFPVIDAQYPGSMGATDFIVIRHLPDKSIYTIVCKKVTPCDSNREGTLYISVAVPVKEHVEGLFNMLIELQNAFKSSCMTYDGKWYHFLDRPENPQIFAEILSRHKVGRYPYRPVATSDDTSSIAYLYLTTDQISDILDDPMRGEFARFGQIVLVPVADPAAYTSTINVPAKIWRCYKIYVNGRQTGQTLSDPNKTVTITLPETGSHESASTTFSISQARETRMPGIAVDDEAQIIYLNLQPKHKPMAAPKPKSIDTAIEEANRKKKNKLYAIIAGCAVVILAVLIYFLCFAPKEDNKTENPTANENVNYNGNNSDYNDNKSDYKDNNSDDNNTGQESDPILNSDDNESYDGDGNYFMDDPQERKDNDDNGEENGIVDDKNNPRKGTVKNPVIEDAERVLDQSKQLLDKYNLDVNTINGSELNFNNFTDIKYRYINYENMEGYPDLKARIDFIDGIITYLNNLNDDVKVSDYTKQIKEYINQANKLGLNELSNKLKKRISSDDANKVKESMKVKNKF